MVSVMEPGGLVLLTKELSIINFSSKPHGLSSHCLEIFTPFPPACIWNKWLLYSSQVNDRRNHKGCLEVTSCSGTSIVAFAGGEAKYTMDIRASDSFTTARCSTFRNRPFVQAFTQPDQILLRTPKTLLQLVCRLGSQIRNPHSTVSPNTNSWKSPKLSPSFGIRLW